MLLRGIDARRNYYAKYYWVVFLARRLIFVSMPLILMSAPGLQIITILIQQLAYIIIYGNVMG